MNQDEVASVVIPPSYSSLIGGVFVIIVLTVATGWSLFFQGASDNERGDRVKTTEITQPMPVISSYQKKASGAYEQKGDWGFIHEFNSELPNGISYFFGINSTVGKQIAEVCSPGEICIITAQVVQRTDFPIKMDWNADAIFEVISVDSVESTKDDAVNEDEFRIRAGEIRIDNENPNGKVFLLENRTIYINKTAKALSIEQLFSLDDRDAILLKIDSADLSCPMSYVFISIFPDGRTEISKGFGNCSSVQGVEQQVNNIRITLSESEKSSEKVFIYQDGTLAEEIIADGQNGTDVSKENPAEDQTALPEKSSVPVPTRSESQRKRVLAVLKAASTNEWEDMGKLVADIRRHAVKMDYGDRKLARVSNQEGLMLLEQKQYVKAINAFGKGLSLSPADIEIRNNLAYAYMLNGNFQEAQDHLLNIVLRVPDRTSAWVTYSEVLARAATEQPEDAEAFKKVSHAFLRLAVYFSANRQKTSEYLKRISQTHTILIYRNTALMVLREIEYIPSVNSQGVASKSSDVSVADRKVKKGGGVTEILNLLKKIPKGEMPEDDPWK